MRLLCLSPVAEELQVSLEVGDARPPFAAARAEDAEVSPVELEQELRLRFGRSEEVEGEGGAP